MRTIPAFAPINPEAPTDQHDEFVGRHNAARLELRNVLYFLHLFDENWRRGWDSNPRWTVNPRRFSRPVLSTTQPPLRRDRPGP